MRCTTTLFGRLVRLRAACAPVSGVARRRETHDARNLWLEAGNAVRFGLPPDVAFRAVRAGPTEILGVATGPRGRSSPPRPPSACSFVEWRWSTTRTSHACGAPSGLDGTRVRYRDRP